MSRNIAGLRRRSSKSGRRIKVENALLGLSPKIPPPRSQRVANADQVRRAAGSAFPTRISELSRINPLNTRGSLASRVPSAGDGCINGEAVGNGG
jgi:hypothetical protein